ncbi:hypothetical protein C240_22 [Enterococcus sp. 5H]|nr:hypothetical protein [Enterococcus sp. 5H]
MSAGNLLLHSGKAEREVMDIVLVEAEKGSEDTYELLYRVTYEENGHTVTLGIKLMSAFIGDKFQVINVPSIMHIQENKGEATAVYRAKDYHTAGEVVPEEERKQIAAFLERFFDMYVSNDERLSLVSAVEGLGTGEFNQFTIENLVQIDEDTYAIQGTYTFQIENSQLTSFFDSQIKKNKESYFVEAFN